MTPNRYSRGIALPLTKAQIRIAQRGAGEWTQPGYLTQAAERARHEAWQRAAERERAGAEDEGGEEVAEA